jgi:hypothetical protein
MFVSNVNQVPASDYFPSWDDSQFFANGKILILAKRLLSPYRLGGIWEVAIVNRDARFLGWGSFLPAAERLEEAW